MISHKVLAGLQMMNFPYEFVKVDYFTSEQKSEKNMKLNPCATLPFAVIPGAKEGHNVITESNAILQWAADHQSNDSYYPKDLTHRAQVNRWLLWESSVWFPSCYVYLVEYVVKPLMKAEPDQSVIDGEAPRMHRLCKVLDDHLAKHKWLTGDHPTIADIAVASPMHLYEASKLPFENYPNLRRWMNEGIEKIPAWEGTMDGVRILVPDCNKPPAVPASVSD